MNFTRENARDSLSLPEKRPAAVFGGQLIGAYSAAFPSVSAETVIGAAGLPFPAPICTAILNTPETAQYLDGFAGHDVLFVFGDTIRQYTTDGEVAIPEDIASSLQNIFDFVCRSAGTLDEAGEHVIDLKAGKIGTHFDVNLLIGNRIGFPSPLLTTPKGVLDSLGLGSSRGTAP